MRNVVSTIATVMLAICAVIFWFIHGIFKLLEPLGESLLYHLWNRHVWCMHDVAKVVTNNGYSRLHDVFSYPEEICENIVHFYAKGGNIEKLKSLSKQSELFCGLFMLFILYAVPTFFDFVELEMHGLNVLVWLAAVGYFAYYYLLYKRIQTFVSELIQVA